LYRLNTSHARSAPQFPPPGPLVVGDRRDALYAELQPLVRRLLRQYGDCPELRLDLVGEIYHRFCLLFAAYDPGRGIPLKPYLVRSLTASVYSYARSEWARRRRAERGFGDRAETRDSWPDLAEWYCEKERRLALLESLPRAISALPERQRRVLVLRYYESRSFDEIGLALQVRSSTARSLLRHAIKNLRADLRSDPRTGLAPLRSV